jgi:hypothetical protein
VRLHVRTLRAAARLVAGYGLLWINGTAQVDRQPETGPAHPRLPSSDGTARCLGEVSRGTGAVDVADAAATAAAAGKKAGSQTTFEVSGNVAAATGSWISNLSAATTRVYILP